MQGLELLEATRLTEIIQGLQDVRDLPQELVFSQRVKDVDAVDSEIMARFVGRVLIADIIADDQKAPVYSAQKLNFETTNIPNLKIGVNLSQEMLNQLASINAYGGVRNDQTGMFNNYQMRTLDGLRVGVMQRKEALCVAMMVDGLNYDRLGIKLTGVTWGMPSDLKITTAVAWTDVVNATPVSDILTTKRMARVRYGQVFDRLTMSTAAFDYMTKTNDFINRARFILGAAIAPATMLPIQDTSYMKNLALGILGVRDIELYDARYWVQNTAGLVSSTAYLPTTQVILSSTQDDGDTNIYDFANAVVTETTVSSMVGSSMIGNFSGPQRGPVSYATAPVDLNPPSITMFAVQRGFPRKHRLQSSAVLTVGTFADDIPVGVPF